MGYAEAHEVAGERMRRCTAKSKTTGQQCRQSALTGSTKCHYHGGATPRGEASPHWRSGRHARHLPERLLARYAEAEADPKMLEQRDELALIDARIADLLSIADTGESGQAWRAMRDLWRQAAGNPEARDDLLRQIGAILDSRNDAPAWAGIQSWIETRRHVAESERRRELEARSSITVSAVFDLLYTIYRIVTEHTDEATRAAVWRDLSTLLGKEGTDQ
jgi:hypothetical protein